MSKVAKMGGVLLVLAAMNGCALQPTPSQQISQSDYSGTGDRMASCMQYASESYCERQVWGGGEL